MTVFAQAALFDVPRAPLLHRTGPRTRFRAPLL